MKPHSTPMLLTAVVLLLPYLTQAHHTHHAATQALHTIERTNCPCHFTIAARHANQPIDILVIPVGRTRPHPTLSRLAQTNSHAVLRDAATTFHSLTIPQRMSVSVHIRHSGGAPHARTTISILTARASCPVVLTQHAPRTTSTPATTRARARRTATPRIVGGLPAAEDLADYLVYFQTPGDEPNKITICSGTLVSPTTAITAAHCDLRVDTIAFVGLREVRPADGRRGPSLLVINFEIPRSYTDSNLSPSVRLWWDFAVVTLSGRLPDSAKFMKVNVNSSNPVVGSFARTAGYGILDGSPDNEEDFNRMGRLNQVDVPIVSHRECTISYTPEGESISRSHQLCAGYINGGGCDSW